MLCQGILPDDLVPPCLDILRILSASERDLIRIIVEIIHELRDSDTDDDDMVRLSLYSLFLRYLICKEANECRF